MMRMIAATIASCSFGIEGSCYTMIASLPKMSNLALRLLVRAQRHTCTTDAGVRLHFGCTAQPLMSRLSLCTLQTGPIVWVSCTRHCWRLHWVQVYSVHANHPTRLKLLSCAEPLFYSFSETNCVSVSTNVQHFEYILLQLSFTHVYMPVHVCICLRVTG